MTVLFGLLLKLGAVAVCCWEENLRGGGREDGGNQLFESKEVKKGVKVDDALCV